MSADCLIKALTRSPVHSVFCQSNSIGSANKKTISSVFAVFQMKRKSDSDS
ncbi:hypothetical protein V5799_002727, partial [Amblyomma americanum]